MNKNITINILPQSTEAWLYIFLAVIGFSFFSGIRAGIESHNRVREAEFAYKSLEQLAK